MGYAPLQVRFPDGTVRFGKYHGTSDVPYRNLVVRLEDWVRDPRYGESVDGEGDPVPVGIATSYGGGFHWTGTAMPSYLVDSGLWEDVLDYSAMDRCEQWTAPCGLRETTDGLPDWWIG